MGLLLPLPSGERQASIHFSYWKIRRVHCFFYNLDILHLLNTKAILFYIPRWLWKNWEAGKVSLIISQQILETNLSHVLFSNIGDKFVTCVILLLSGCSLDDGSQPGDHLGGGEAAEEEVNP